MIQITDLLPPMNGPLANPLLFGVAAGLSVLFPLDETEALADDAGDSGRDGAPDGAWAASSLET